MSTTGARKGLVLTLGGAPSEPHTVPGVPGQFHPDRPVPVGGEGELSLTRAEQIDKDPRLPLALVDLPVDADVDELRDQAEADVQAGRAAVREARKPKASQGDEVDRITDHAKAVKAEKGGE